MLSPESLEPTVTVPAAAAQVGVHPVTLRRAIARGEDLPFRVIRLGSVIRIPQADLDALVGAR